MDPKIYSAAKTFSARTFDPKILLRAQPGRVDPWARHEAWRYSGPFGRWNRFRGALPGLALGTAAFVAHCVYEELAAGKADVPHH